MYKISELTGLTYTNENVLVPQDDTKQLWQDWYQWKLNGGVEESFPSTEEEINDLKTKELNELREQTNELLKQTDWYFIRNLDASSDINDIPIEVLNERSEIRTNYDLKKQEIINKYS